MSRKKIDFVNVPAYDASCLGYSRPAIDRFVTPSGHDGDYSRVGVQGTWTKAVESPVWLDGNELADIADTFQRIATELGCDKDSLTLDIRVEDDYAETYLRGHRDATPEEVATVLAYREWQAKQNDLHIERQREALVAQARKLGLTAKDLA